MSKDHNLIVNMTFNPPFLSIVGPIKENTVLTLNTLLPQVTTTTSTAKTKFTFQRRDDPPCWYGELPCSFANEEVGQTRLTLALLDALEEEGGWKLKGSNATNHDIDKVTYKYFFVRTL